MGKIAEDLIKMIETREKYQEFQAASEKALSIFEQRTGITLQYIKETLESDMWSQHIRYLDDNIDVQFSRLSQAYINRDQFKDNCKGTINWIKEQLDDLKKRAEESERIFYEDYEKYFKEEKDSVFLTPKVKEIIIKFMMS